LNLFDMVKSMKERDELSWNVIAQKVRHLRQFDNGEALRAWYRRERNKQRVDSPELKTSVHIDPDGMPPSLPQPFDDVMMHELKPGESALVLADIHVPYHHEEFIKDAVNTAQEYGSLNRIIVAGDLFTFDQISKYSKAHNMPRMETELEIGGSMLMYLADIVPVSITNSNHDARFATRIDAQFSLKRLMNAALNGRKPKHKIETTERDYLFVNDDVIVGHLTNATAVAGKIAHNIAQKYQRHCLAGHDHIAGVFNPRSRYIGASIGCAAEFKKFWYSEKGMSPIKFMQRGYAVITGGEHSTTVDLYNSDHKLYYSRSEIEPGVFMSKIIDEHTT
jgi:hypothetical protein